MVMLNHMPEFTDFLDYSSTDCIENVLRHYYDIEALALAGSSCVLDLYVEIKRVFKVLGESESQAILEAVGTQDEIRIKEAAKKIIAVLGE